MAKFRLTSARVDLMRAIKAGDVATHFPIPPDPVHVERSYTSKPPRVVTAQAAALHKAGVARVVKRQAGQPWHCPLTWELTEEGERLLADQTQS